MQKSMESTQSKTQPSTPQPLSHSSSFQSKTQPSTPQPSKPLSHTQSFTSQNHPSLSSLLSSDKASNVHDNNVISNKNNGASDVSEPCQLDQASISDSGKTSQKIARFTIKKENSEESLKLMHKKSTSKRESDNDDEEVMCDSTIKSEVSEGDVKLEDRGSSDQLTQLTSPPINVKHKKGWSIHSSYIIYNTTNAISITH